MGAGIPVQIGQVIDNKFRIDRVLAQGGMGVLCAATHLHLDQKIAIKFRLAGSKLDATRFIREAQLAVRLQNRHVCRVMDLGYIDEATPYIVMEYLDGNDLAQQVERHGPLSIEEAAEYMLQACDAMAEAHSLGIVHRDIKPENLFLARQHDGRTIVKVLDFGISKQHGVTLTTESDLMGTPAYMAHEQWASAKHVTGSSDIYALGATLHFMLTGKPPHEATTIPEMFAKISTQEPPRLRTLRADVPADLEALVLRCLARKPDDRPADVLALGDALLPFTPARKQAALSVVGRASARGSDGAATQPMSAAAMGIPFKTPSGTQLGVATGSPLSTNDLAVGVRSSSEDVPPSPRRWKLIAFALGGLAAAVVIVVAITSSRGKGGPIEPQPPSTLPVTQPTPDVTATVTPDVEVDAAIEPAPVDAAVVAVDAATKPTRVDAGVRLRDASVRTVDASVVVVPADAAVSLPPPIDAPAAKPADAATLPKDACPPGDYRCSLRK